MSLQVRPFYLLRHEDASGISGVGVVGVGCVFPNNEVVFQWASYRSSLEIHHSLENFEEIHGHGGKTEVVFGKVPDSLKQTKKKKTV